MTDTLPKSQKRLSALIYMRPKAQTPKNTYLPKQNTSKTKWPIKTFGVFQKLVPRLFISGQNLRLSNPGLSNKLIRMEGVSGSHWTHFQSSLMNINELNTVNSFPMTMMVTCTDYVRRLRRARWRLLKGSFV